MILLRVVDKYAWVCFKSLFAGWETTCRFLSRVRTRWSARSLTFVLKNKDTRQMRHCTASSVLTNAPCLMHLFYTACWRLSTNHASEAVLFLLLNLAASWNKVLALCKSFRKNSLVPFRNNIFLKYKFKMFCEIYCSIWKIVGIEIKI